MAISNTKKTPIRTCCACGLKSNKSAFVRVVRSKDGIIELDTSGRMPGRGTYVCTNPQCVNKAIKQNKLGRALRITIDEQEAKRLEKQLLDYIKNITPREGMVG